MSDNPSTRLRKRIEAAGRPILLPGAPNALTARLLEDIGYEAAYLSGAGISNTFLGVPDVGLLTLTELASNVAAVRDVVDLPLVVDADTGFGNAINVQRTIRVLERAGANAVQIEDQVAPKRCGHFTGKAVIEASEMVGKIHAATDARTDDDLLIIARTDARAVSGLHEACDRAARYLDAGADIAFVEAPRSREELREIPQRVPGAHMANMVEGALTPIVPLNELGSYGFAVVLYANTAMRAAITGMRAALAELRECGDSLGLGNRIASWEERQSLVRKDTYDAMNERYAG